MSLREAPAERKARDLESIRKMERKGTRVKLGEKRLQVSCVLEAGQPRGVCAMGAEGGQWECGSGPFSGMAPGIRPRGAAVLHPWPAAGAPAGNGPSSLAARRPPTEFSAGMSGLHSV